MFRMRAVYSGFISVSLATSVVRFTFRAVTVVGSSMEPTLSDGDRLLVMSRRVRTPRLGDLVVFAHPVPGAEPSLLVKRLVEICPREEFAYFVVRGDAVESLDSRNFGPIDSRTLVGVVVARLNTPGCIYRSAKARSGARGWLFESTAVGAGLLAARVDGT